MRYQYRRGETDSWKDIPAQDVRRKADGTTLAAWPAGVTSGNAEALSWNVTDTLTEDGPVDARAVFTDGTASMPPRQLTSRWSAMQVRHPVRKSGQAE
ncbi:hypothetical protein [Streptomyces cadmiisoli]|uniref:Uncharacterized protein n=1 Tax=Streptomyces cadmiisoli TaxID=2184053 RepID=A0A2Z4JAJ9_9ACTN|nr:hypothetical protein [Streptomyces cadmiisoli]AWW41957.1 hypothetical protein DN051_39490 [Streptomyces cadmiisoli]